MPLCCLHAPLLQDKLGLASRFPTLSLINDACFALAFFLARICLGALDSMRFFRAIVRHRQDAPVGLLLVVSLNPEDDLDVTRSGTSLKFACPLCSVTVRSRQPRTQRSQLVLVLQDLPKAGANDRGKWCGEEQW